MAFPDISERIVEILAARRVSLTAGMGDKGLVIENQFAVEHFAPQVLFVYRESVSDLDYGNISSPGEGASAHGEIEGRGIWIVSAHCRYTGNEQLAADQLAQLAWNLLSVLAGYTRDTENHYLSLFVEGSTPDYSLGASGGVGWYVGERFRLRVGWDLTF